MFSFIRRIASDDAAVKLLFDHLRNIGICAVVFAAAVWKFNNMAPGYLYFFDALIIVLLTALGSFLFLVNQFHGLATIRRAERPIWLLQLVMHAYSILAVTIVFAILGVQF